MKMLAALVLGTLLTAAAATSRICDLTDPAGYCEYVAGSGQLGGTNCVAPSVLNVTCSNLNISEALNCLRNFNMSCSIGSLQITNFPDTVLYRNTLSNADFPSLTTLILSSGSLESVQPDAFDVTGLSTLTHLGLQRNNLMEIGYSSITDLEELVTLDLSFNTILPLQLDSNDTDDTLCFLSTLTVVTLTGNTQWCDCCSDWALDRNCSDQLVNVSRDCEGSGTASCRRGNCSSKDDALETWHFIAIGAGALVVGLVACCTFFFCCWCCCCRSKGQKSNDSMKMKFDNQHDGSSNSETSQNGMNLVPTGGFREKLRTLGKSIKIKSLMHTEPADLTYDYIVHTKSKLPWKRKRPQSTEHIYDLNEMDSKIEGFYAKDVSIDELTGYIPQLCLGWYQLGTRLGMATEKLDLINLAIGNHEQRCLKMLDSWINATNSLHNWETFLDALGNGSEIDHVVAERIHQVYSTKALMDLVINAIKHKEKVDVINEAWNYFLSKAEITPSYCGYFTEVKGLDLLLYCNQLFLHDVELKANVFFLLDIMAKSPTLQLSLLRSDVLNAIKTELMYNPDQTISFTAGSIISSLAYLGDDAWGYLIPSRKDMFTILLKSMKRWHERHNMQIDQRGLQDLDFLLMIATCTDGRVAYWGLWAINNHCLTHGDKYCSLLKANKLSQIEQLCSDAKTTPVKSLCERIIKSCAAYQETEIN